MSHENFVPLETSHNQVSQVLVGFFGTEIGRQWLDACLDIFRYSIDKMKSHLKNGSLRTWKMIVFRVENWNNVRISRWMEEVVMPRFKHAAIFWRKDKESPLLMEYVNSTFESSTGTVSVQIPPLKDFLYCSFSQFLKTLVDLSQLPSFSSNHQNQDPNEEFLKTFNNNLKIKGTVLAVDALRTAFIRVVNPCIRIETRPSNDSISMIMNLPSKRVDKRREESDFPYESSIHFHQKRAKEHQKSRHSVDVGDERHSRHSRPSKTSRHSHHYPGSRDPKPKDTSKTSKPSSRREDDHRDHKDHKDHKDLKENKEQREERHRFADKDDKGEKRRMDEFMSAAQKRSQSSLSS